MGKAWNIGGVWILVILAIGYAEHMRNIPPGSERY